MKKLLLAMVLSTASLASFAQDVITDVTTIKCEQEKLYKPITGNSNTEEAIDVFYCSFREEWEYHYGANFLEVTAHTAQLALGQIESICAKKGLRFGRYIRGMAPGGIENFKVENKETDYGVVAKITGNFYCTPNIIRLFRR